MYKCFCCGFDFEHFLVLHDSQQIGEDDYNDEYVCPNCHSDDFEYIEDAP